MLNDIARRAEGSISKVTSAIFGAFGLGALPGAGFRRWPFHFFIKFLAKPAASLMLKD